MDTVYAELRVAWREQGGDFPRGMWRTEIVAIPADTPESELERVAIKAFKALHLRGELEELERIWLDDVLVICSGCLKPISEQRSGVFICATCQRVLCEDCISDCEDCISDCEDCERGFCHLHFSGHQCPVPPERSVYTHE